jgi:ABC-type sugar transport system permease subunit
MTDGSNIVTIRDIDVPFWRIVLILVKWAIASIPAMIILALLVAILGALMAEVLGFLGLDVSGVPTSPTPQ